MVPSAELSAAAGSPFKSVLGTLYNRETGQHRPPRSTTHLQQAFINQQLRNFTLTTLPDAQQAVDKAFCSLWLDSDTVLIGTKCNSLMMLQPRCGSYSLLQYPQQQQQQWPGYSSGGEQQPVPAAISCGQHALALSPDGQWLATGGRAPNDILLWHVGRQEQQQQQQQQQQQLGERSCAAAACRSRKVVQPVQALTGHTDWVFDMAWLDGSHFVSAGRDRLIKLWQLPQDATAAAGCGSMRFSEEPGAALSTVRYHTDKVRCVKYDQQQQAVVTAGLDGVIAFWTPEMQLAGACNVSSEFLAPQTLLVQGNLIVVGTQKAAVLIDRRVSHTPAATVAVAEAPPLKKRRVEAPATAAAGSQATDATWHLVQQQQQQLQHESETSDEESTGSYSESDDEASASEGDEHAGDAEQLAQGGAEGSGQQQQQQQQQNGVDAVVEQRRTAGQLLSALRSNNVAAQWRLQQLLPGDVVYAIQRFVENEQRMQQVRPGSVGMSTADLQPYRQHDSNSGIQCAAEPQGRLAARVTGSICVAGQNGLAVNGVRSLSLHHHLLGLGCCGGQLLMHDMRKLSSTAAALAHSSSSSSRAAERLQQWPLASGNASSSTPLFSSSWVSGSSETIPARVGCLQLPQLAWRPPAAAAAPGGALNAELFWAPSASGGGSMVYNASELAVFTHAWDPSGTQLFIGGGPVVLAGKGCSLALCS